MRRLIDGKQKLGNKMAIGKAVCIPKAALRVLDTGHGTTTDPTQITQLIDPYYR